MFCFHEKLQKADFAKGIKLMVLGAGRNMNVLHWNMANGTSVPPHEHPEEQFGYVIKGGFKMQIGDDEATLKAGDCYFIPPNAQHCFTAIDDTEAIDVFSPVRVGPAGGKTQSVAAGVTG